VTLQRCAKNRYRSDAKRLIFQSAQGRHPTNPASELRNLGSKIDPARIGAAERQLIAELGISWRMRDDALLRQLAAKYIWWETPDEALERPERVIAQVMNIGDYEDVQALAEHVGDDVLRDVLTHAEVGWFNERSWHYWHYRLGLAELEQVPPMPSRQVE